MAVACARSGDGSGLKIRRAEHRKIGRTRTSDVDGQSMDRTGRFIESIARFAAGAGGTTIKKQKKINRKIWGPRGTTGNPPAWPVPCPSKSDFVLCPSTSEFLTPLRTR